MILSDSQWTQSETHNADVVVVGAGAAGISLALDLAKSGTSVILLEGGKEQYTPGSQDCYRGSISARDLPYGLLGSRLRFLGGSTNCWAGGCGELDEEDFAVRDWVPLSGWPIEKVDLIPWYERAAEYLQLDIQRLRNPSGVAGLPMLEGLDLGNLEFTSKIRFSTEFREELNELPNLHLLTGANFKEAIRDWDGSRIDALLVRSEAGLISKVTASNAYVIACGGIENARLLLNTKSSRFEAIGNVDDNLGRFFSDHPTAPCASLVGLGGDVEHSIYDVRNMRRSSDEKLALPFYRLPYAIQQRFETLNVSVQVHSQEKALTSVENSAWRIKKFLEDQRSYSLDSNDIVNVMSHPIQIAEAIKARNQSRGRLALRFQMEQAPDPTNRITLTDEVDQHGLHRVNLNWSFSEIERRTLDVAMSHVAHCLQREGIGTLHIDQQLTESRTELPIDLRGGQHHCGSTRMSSNRKYGVVDKNLKVHETKNLFVCGSSVFPTNGWVNPTFTIIALSLRLAAHLKASYS